MLPSRDHELVQIVDAALTSASVRARKSDGTSWLACRPGCTPCCHGVFCISALDAKRLHKAFRTLQREEPARAEALRVRAESFTHNAQATFPGDAATGLLDPEEHGTWNDFADLPEADAPVLDPATGRCELYEARPLTCRIFGPPVMNESGIGICELCYVGASETEVLHGEMHLHHQNLEAELDRDLPSGETVIAWALLQEWD